MTDTRGSSRLVSVVIPSHNGLYLLRPCLGSIMAQTYKSIEVVVVDNGSSDGTVKELKASYPEVKVIVNDRNLGFAKAVNKGIAASVGNFVFLLNNDTELAPDCVEQLVFHMRSLRSGRKNVIGLAPKIKFREFPGIIDAIGTGITPSGTGYNVGVGQIDIGQFNQSEQVFGACFAAAFISKSAFEEIGLLDERYFAYYEDIDWCYLANTRGFEFWTSPEALVHHRHSSTVRSMMAYERKYYLLHRNKIRFIAKNFHRENLLKALFAVGFHIREALHVLMTPFSRPPRRSLGAIKLQLKIIVSSLRAVALFPTNIALGRKRTVSDPDIWDVSSKQFVKTGVSGTFEDETHSPIVSLDTLMAAYSNFQRLQPDERILKSLAALQFLNDLHRTGSLHFPKPHQSKSRTTVHCVLCMLGDRYYAQKKTQSCVLDQPLGQLLTMSALLSTRELKDLLWQFIVAAKKPLRDRTLRGLLDEAIETILGLFQEMELIGQDGKSTGHPRKVS